MVYIIDIPMIANDMIANDMIANDMIAPIIVLYSNLSALEIDGVNDTLNKSNLLKQLKIEFMISIYRIFLFILLIFIKNHK